MKQLNKTFSFVLVCVLFVSLFSFSASADSTVTYSLYDFTFVTGTDKPTTFTSISSDIGTVTRVYYSSTTSAKASGYYKLSNQLLADTSYTFTVKTKRLTGNNASVMLYLSDKATEVSSTAVLVADIDIGTSSSWKEYSSQFKFPSKYENKQVYLVAVISVPAAANQFYVSDFTFTDNNPVTKDGFFDGLLEKIKEFFDNLWDGISQGFADIVDKIQNTATVIVDGIGEFFDTLIDYILYFQHPVELNADGVPINTDTGEPIYTNPFESKLEEVFAKLQEWIDSIDNFITNMNTARDNVTGYMDTGKQLIDGVITGVPIISAVLIFVCGFYVIRKVVGQ